MIIADRWEKYRVIDCGDGEKLEDWGGIRLRRPDPQTIWPRTLSEKEWNSVHAFYHRSDKGGGFWEQIKRMPKQWTLDYKLITGEKICFDIEPTGFKHTGLFPEQAANWDWMADLIHRERSRLGDGDEKVRVLNLFAYTGGATVACAAAGASVCHVDASKGMVAKAKGNAQLSGLENAPVKYFVDDVKKLVQREIRRGNVYDGILLDPPSYGRGPKGELWQLENELFDLVNECAKLISDRPIFFLINSYTTGLAPAVLKNVMIKTLGPRLIKQGINGVYTADELALSVAFDANREVYNKGLVLPCGSSGRWQVERKIDK